MNLPPQASYLYHGLWTPATDSVVIDTMIRLKKETRWAECTFPSWFFMTIAHELNTTAGVVVSEEEVAKRIEMLHRRYRVFKAVVVLFRAQWDQTNKIVVAGDDLWEKIMKYDWFAGACYHNEEPEYLKLACVFGMDDVKLEAVKEIIVISDKTEKLPSEEHFKSDSDEGTEEVNSPAVIPPVTVRRKLFDEDPPLTDLESTNDLGVYFIDLAPDGQLRTRFEKGRALPPPPPMKANGEVRNPGVGGAFRRSPHASSCGSNSPIPRWPHLAK